MRLKESRDIVFVTGLRRVGKTTLLYQFIRRLLHEVEAKRILYVSLDNLALMDYSIAEIVENGVFLRLVREGEVRYYRRNHREVDFVQGKRALESRYKRKIEKEEIACISGLRGYREKVVITENVDGKMDGVRLLSLWRFLLN